MRVLALVAILSVTAPLGAQAEEDSWIFRASYYSHSPVDGQRVAQYCPESPSVVRFDPTYQESGYRHNESNIRVGTSADHLHVVQTWGMGDAIRPYGEWEFPFRAGATPYGPWGNPQGPWTLPFQSWQNPFALGQNQNWGPWWNRQSGGSWSNGPWSNQGSQGPGNSWGPNPNPPGPPSGNDDQKPPRPSKPGSWGQGSHPRNSNDWSQR